MSKIHVTPDDVTACKPTSCRGCDACIVPLPGGGEASREVSQLVIVDVADSSVDLSDVPIVAMLAEAARRFDLAEAAYRRQEFANLPWFMARLASRVRAVEAAVRDTLPAGWDRFRNDDRASEV